MNYHIVYMIVSFFQWRFLYKYNVVLTRSFSAPMIHETQNFTLAQLTFKSLHADFYQYVGGERFNPFLSAFRS